MKNEKCKKPIEINVKTIQLKPLLKKIGSAKYRFSQIFLHQKTQFFTVYLRVSQNVWGASILKSKSSNYSKKIEKFKLLFVKKILCCHLLVHIVMLMKSEKAWPDRKENALSFFKCHQYVNARNNGKLL